MTVVILFCRPNKHHCVISVDSGGACSGEGVGVGVGFGVCVGTGGYGGGGGGVGGCGGVVDRVMEVV